MGEFGGCIFVQQQGGIYEAHTVVLPQGRGEWAVTTVREALHWMFTRTDAIEIWTRCPKGNLGARALARAIGGQEEMTVRNGWVKDNEIIPAAIFSLHIQNWMKSAPNLESVGHWFHEQLKEEYKLKGFNEQIHPDDNVHDRYVGGVVEMIRNGQPNKGIIFYNRFAAMAGYEPIKLISTDPVTVDIRDAVLELHGRNFFVSSVASQTKH